MPAMLRRRKPLLYFACLLSGCFVPTIRDGEVQCGKNGECPSSFNCGAGGLCFRKKAPDGGSLVPSHVAASYLQTSAADLMGATRIDTDLLQLAFGGALAAPPPGVAFVKDDAGYSVLSLGAWSAPVDVSVTGARPLVVIAAGKVTIGATVRVAASFERPGPGASVLGTGGDGATSPVINDAGGGGGGFSSTGASGGDSGKPAKASGGNPGAMYGDSRDFFGGGSAGGDGGSAATCPAPAGRGGGGGGALQITSSSAVEITGAIDASGGGGRGGCGDGKQQGNSGTAGGGGGSGGQIFIEAPRISVAGSLGANGGGGGGGGVNSGADGQDGANGSSSLLAAPGGAGATKAQGDGGNGGASGPPTPGGEGNNGGGGGGAAGRIWLRTRGGAASVGGATISPTPMFQTDL
jgi:hypothetical protein